MDELETYVRRLFGKLQERNQKRDDDIKSFQEEMEERFIKNLPSQTMGKKKRPRQDDQDKENESTASESQPDQASLDQTALRPVRTAKINANKNLKEPDERKKMRQPSGEELMQLEKIKEEPVDVPKVKRETGTKKKVKKEPLSLLPPREEPRTSKDSDIEVLAQPEEIVEVLSDNEAEKMPPPALPAPKARKARTKKKKTSTEKIPIRESQIKKETPQGMEPKTTRSSSRKASGESQYEDALDVPQVPQLMPHPESPVPMNATFDVPPEGAEALHNSLMTEDNSVEYSREDLLPLKQLKKKHPHELFNPCIQSPLRTKVEAFERHAAASALPIPKVKIPEERVTQGTPLGAKKTLYKSASTSKLAHIVGIGATKKPRAGTASASKATTRSASAEDTKRGLNALQQVAEEKRRKREERHKQAQLAREAKEREKEERHRRLMLEQHEREEKMRAERNKAMKAKTAQEKEQERKLEEMQRHKAAQKKRAAEKYGFEMLCSDDSTDDEGKASTKRPQPPLWSTKPRRKELNAIQEVIPQQLIDILYMLQPMSPDLKEIFPDIDPRNLHRNSSVVWATPPKR